MANLKNITDLPVAESAEGLNLIVNDNGSAKQIAANKIGRITVNGIVPDENDNIQLDIVSSWNDLEDKPLSYYIPDVTNSYIENIDIYNALMAFSNNPAIGFPNIVIRDISGHLCKVIGIRHVSDEGGRYVNLKGFRLTYCYLLGDFTSKRIVVALTQDDANSIENEDMA